MATNDNEQAVQSGDLLAIGEQWVDREGHKFAIIGHDDTPRRSERRYLLRDSLGGERWRSGELIEGFYSHVANIGVITPRQ